MIISPDRAGTDEQLLEMLADATLPLADIAACNKLTLPELARWADQPRIRATFRSLRRLARGRADLIAADNAAAAMGCLRAIVSVADDDERNSLPTTDPRTLAIRARARESARKAGAQILSAARPRPSRRAAHLRAAAGSEPAQGHTPRLQVGPGTASPRWRARPEPAEASFVATCPDPPLPSHKSRPRRKLSLANRTKSGSITPIVRGLAIHAPGTPRGRA